MTRVDELSDQYVEEFAGLDPCAASIMGISGHDGELTDYSPEGFAARDALNRRTRAALTAVAGPGGGPAEGQVAEHVAARLLREHLDRETACVDAGVTAADLNILDGPLCALRRSIELLDQGPATPWPDLLARLRALPGSLAGLRATLTHERQAGRVAALRQVLRNAGDCDQAAGYLPTLARAYGDGPLHGPLAAVSTAATAAPEVTGPASRERAGDGGVLNDPLVAGGESSGASTRRRRGIPPNRRSAARATRRRGGHSAPFPFRPTARRRAGIPCFRLGCRRPAIP